MIRTCEIKNIREEKKSHEALKKFSYFCLGKPKSIGYKNKLGKLVSVNFIYGVMVRSALMHHITKSSSEIGS